MTAKTKGAFSRAVTIFLRTVTCFVWEGTFHTPEGSGAIVFCMTVLLAASALDNGLAFFGILNDYCSMKYVLNFFSFFVVRSWF